MKNPFRSILLVLCAGVATAGRAAAQVSLTSASVAEREALPGDTYEGRITLLNATGQPQEAKIYLTDYAFFADGRNLYPAPGTMSRSNARWITFTPSQVQLAPGARATVTYRVAVPAAGRPSGSYWSMVMVETIMRGSAESSTGARQVRIGMDTKIRYATQIATHIGSTGLSSIAFDSVRASIDADGTKRVSFDFLNTGERAHRLTISLSLYNEAGELVKSVQDTRGLLYPGSAGRQLFNLGAVPRGVYRALIVADGGGSEIFGGQYTLRF